MTQTILVTGAAGFIGCHLAERLLNMGHQVIGLDNFDTYYPVAVKRQNARCLNSSTGFKLIEGDIRDAALLDWIFTGNKIDTVMHLAARAGVRPSIEDPLLYQDVNIRGTLNLLEACRSHSAGKFIFASSSSVYGVNGRSPFKEEANVNQPISPYAASKASAELYCRTYNHLYGLPVISLRLFTVYGPKQRPDLAIHKFVKLIDSGAEVTVYGDGTADRDYTYIDDIVDGFTAALSYPVNNLQVINLGSGRTVNLNRLLEIIQATLGKTARIKHTSTVPGDVPLTLADISKAGKLLGYQPKTSIEEGINRFIRWYRENKELA